MKKLGRAELPCACAGARQMARMLTQLYDVRLRAGGVEAPQFTLLMTLEAMGPCSQVALTKQGAFDKTTVSRNLKMLERKGWIEFQAAAEDGRKRLVALTISGRKRLAAAKPAWGEAQRELRLRMGGTQWDRMMIAFRNVAQAVRHLES